MGERECDECGAEGLPGSIGCRSCHRATEESRESIFNALAASEGGKLVGASTQLVDAIRESSEGKRGFLGHKVRTAMARVERILKRHA